MRYFFKFATNILAIIGVFGLIYFCAKVALDLKRKEEIKELHQKCRHLKSGMTIKEMYQILDNDIRPGPIIRRSANSHYHHYLQYPAKSAKKTPLLIEVDRAEKIIIDVIGCDG